MRVFLRLHGSWAETFTATFAIAKSAARGYATSTMTRNFALLVVMLMIATAAVGQGRASAPVPAIFDTDMGNDIDDALALAMLHAMESRGEAKILAVTVTKGNTWAAPYCDLVDTFYGRPEIPIGMVRDGKTPESSPMIEVPANEKTASGDYVYPHKLIRGEDAEDAVVLLRRTIAAQPDHSVVIVQVGFSTNLARLLATGADQYSALDGTSLARAKVARLVMMAGNFKTGKPEFNLAKDVPAAQALFAKWPTPIVVSGFEIGLALPFPATAIETKFGYVANHPVADAYRHYMKMPYDRPTWDLTAALYAVRPDEKYFDVSEPGEVQVGEKGETKFTPGANGKVRYLILRDEQKARVMNALIELSSQPPDALSKK
jgi:inosine-uridine nucleoside N-ribohydrolase